MQDRIPPPNKGDPVGGLLTSACLLCCSIGSAVLVALSRVPNACSGDAANVTLGCRAACFSVLALPSGSTLRTLRTPLSMWRHRIIGRRGARSAASTPPPLPSRNCLFRKLPYYSLYLVPTTLYSCVVLPLHFRVASRLPSFSELYIPPTYICILSFFLL